MKNVQRFMNVQYAVVQALYWMGFCVSFSFAAVFLQHYGYSNSSLGLVMAFGNIAGFILSPAMAGLIDRSKKIGVFHCLWAMLSLQALMQCIFVFIPGRSALTSVCYCLYMAVIISINPLNTQLSFELEQSFCHINYGAARGVGSLAYAPMAMLMGNMVKRLSPAMLPVAGLICTAAQCLILLALCFLLRKHVSSVPREKSSGNASSLPEFIMGNRRFCILMLGIALLFFAHNLVNNFMINVVRNVGGDAASMGGLNAFIALMELPVMFLYDRLTRRISCPAALRIAAVAFALKALCTALSPNMTALYASQIFQAFSFAVFTPACVRYVNLYIDRRDSAKGQAIAYGMTSLGSIFSGSFGGFMLDRLSVSSTLLIAATFSAVGAVVCLIFSQPAESRLSRSI